MTTRAMDRDDAREALAAVERGRRALLNEVGLPAWYLWGLALGWLALGIVADVAGPWISGAGTLLFGAAHASAYRRVASGRRRSSRVSLRRETVGDRGLLVVLGWLLVMIGVTVVAALLAAADGARHPATMASVLVGVVIVLGGQRAMRFALLGEPREERR
jgi:hypothetical protein